MPRQRTQYKRRTYGFPDDFPERLKRFKEESGLTWAELNRRLGIHPQTMRRWVKGRARPSMRNMMALLELADSLGLAHIFTGLRRPETTGVSNTKSTHTWTSRGRNTAIAMFLPRCL